MTSSHLPRVEQAAEALQQELDRFHAAQHRQEQRDAEARQKLRDDEAAIALEARQARHRLALGEQYVSIDRDFLRQLLDMATRPLQEQLRAAFTAGRQLSADGIRARIEMFERDAEKAIRGRL